MSIIIRLATTDDELQAIYRFRYEIYVEEMRRQQTYADHANHTIIDPLDVGAFVFGAWQDGQLVGTVRSNFLRESDIGDYFEMYRITDIPAEHHADVSLTTRLMVCSSLRKSTLAVRLAGSSYEFGLVNGIKINFIDCNDHLVVFFRALGYRVHRDDLVHPEYGAVTVMRLDLNDTDHLARLRSPFHRIFCRWQTTANPTTSITPSENMP